MKDKPIPNALESLINANKFKKKNIYEDPKFKENFSQNKNKSGFKSIRPQNRGK